MSQTVDTAPPAEAEPTKKKKPVLSEGKRAERRLGWLLCAPAAIVMVAVTGWPIIYSVWLSLQRYDLRFPDQREFVGLRQLRRGAVRRLLVDGVRHHDR